MNFDTTSPETMFSTTNSVFELRKIYQLQRENERMDNSPRDFYSRLIYYLGRLHQKWKRFKRYFMGNLWIITVLNLIVDVMYVFLYLIEIEFNTQQPCTSSNCGQTGLPSFLLVNRLPSAFQLLVGLALFELGLLIVTAVLFVDNIYQFLFSVSIFLELLTIIPFIALSRVKDSKFIYVPYFLRCFLLIPTLKTYLRLRARKGFWKMSEYTEKLIILIAYIWTLLYFGVCSFNYFETKIPSNFPSALSLIDSFYFIVITMSTVGYGEITPKTSPGKLVIVLLIFAGLAFLPGLISDLQETLKMQSSGAGSYTPGRNPFVIICGSFSEPNRMMDFIDSILRRDPLEKTRIVLLSRNKVSVEIKYLIKQFHLRQRVFYFQGSGLDTEDLERVCLSRASGAIILANALVDNLRLEDEHNTLRAWAFDQYAPDVPIFLETLLPQTAIVQEEIVTGVVCINEFKQLFLGYNTLYPGSGSLMINLLRGCKNYSQFDKVWHESYGDGARNEIFKQRMNSNFIGHTFSEISLYLFRQFQVILFGLHMFLPDHNTNHIVLNPGKSYVLKPQDRLLIIAQSRDVLSDIASLTRVEFERTKFPVPRIRRSFTLVIPRPKCIRQAESAETLAFGEELCIGRPQAHNHKVSQCILLKKPALLEDVTVAHSNLTNHVLIVTNNYDIFRYVCTLRLASLMPHEIRPILVLCPRLPTHQEFFAFHSFPQLYFIVGDPHNSLHLKRANIFETHKIVLINMSNSRQESLKMHQNIYSSGSVQARTGSHASEMSDDALADSSTIMISNMIDKMFSDHNKTKPVIVDLIRRTNVKFLIPGSEVSISKNKRSNSTPKPKKKDEPGTISDVYYHPMFASGNVITPIMLESILSSAYEMPALINIFNAFVGIRYPADVEIDKTLSLEQSRLCHVHVPRELAGRPFGDIYKVFSEVQGVVPLGILRTDTRDDNVLPYVITNPLWSWLVNEDDMIYVLAPPSILQ